MSKVICEKDDLVAIADATRQATGSTETYNIASLRSAVVNTFAQGVGGGNADWAENDPDSPSYVKNRTHWVEENENAIILPETTVEASGDDMPPLVTTPFNEPLEEGKTYTVILNGETYVSECGSFSEDGITLPLLGNYKIITTDGAESTGEPFIIMYLTEEAKAAMGVAGMPIYGMLQILEEITFPATLSITGDGTTYHKLNPRFLPDGGVGWTEEDTEEKEILNFSMTQEEWWESGAGPVYFPINGELVVGKTYRVNYNGTDYECLCKSVYYDLFSGSYPTLGNGAINDTTQEPFYIIYLNGKVSGSEDIAVYVGFSQGFEHEFPATVSVYGKGEKIHKIDKKYLPGGNGTKITFREDGNNNYVSDTAFVDAWNMSVSELQAAININYISNSEERSAFGVVKKPYGNGYAIMFYAVPFSDTQTLNFYRFTWFGTLDGAYDAIDFYANPFQITN